MKIYSIIILLFFSFSAAAQDTLHIKLNNYGDLQIKATNIFKNDKIGGLDSMYQHFIRDFSKIKEQIQDSTNLVMEYEYSYQTNNSIKIRKESNHTQEFYLQGKNMQEINNYEICIILIKKTKWEAKLYLHSMADLDKISNLELDSLVKTAQKDLQTRSKIKKSQPYLAIYESFNNKLNISNSIVKVSTVSHDMIMFYPTISTSLINNNLYPRINFHLEISLASKTYYRNIFGINTAHYFSPDPENPFNSKASTFVDFSYRNSYLIDNQETSLGLSFGYLISNTGDIFADNSFKLSFLYRKKNLSFTLGTVLSYFNSGKIPLFNHALPIMGINLNF